MQARVERLELLVEQLQGEIRALRAIVGVGAEDFRSLLALAPLAPLCDQSSAFKPSCLFT